MDYALDWWLPAFGGLPRGIHPLQSRAFVMQRAAATLSLAVLLGLLSHARGEPTPLAKVAFGACVHQDRPQPIWEAVCAAQPQLFIFLGDNIYADTNDIDVMWAKYQQLGNQPGYQQLKKTCPILATWDDHDFGVNDGGDDYPQKRDAQKVFLKFFEAPRDDPRWTREGVYSSYTYGPEGKTVQVILLDARYFRSPLTKGFEPGEPGEGIRGIYAPNRNPATTVLGEAQWRWLEAELKKPAQLRIIGSGVQAVANDHGWEAWANFPHERQRLFDLIRGTKATGVVLISGDRHLAEISRLAADEPSGVGYPLYDITSSSLNAPSGNITAAGTRFTNEVNSHRIGNTYFETNFGFIDIDWTPSDPLLRLQVRDAKGGVVLQQRVRLSELAPQR